MTIRPRIPVATYRLQLSGQLSFDSARELVPYLSALGIGAAYVSPFFRARKGSTHGYDVVNHREVDPSLGNEESLGRFATTLREHGIGLLIDVVPNHMGVDDPHNRWWQDVLEHGPASAYAAYFDIDWNPPKADLQGKVLLALLGDQFGKVLEDGQLQLDYHDQRFVVRYFDRHFPTDPRSWVTILQHVSQVVSARLEPEHTDRMELESITTALEHLPSRNETSPEATQGRYRESEVARRRLAALFETSQVVQDALAETISLFNGAPGDPRSMDRLEALLADQPYRLCYWRVATDEINYRRFFDVDALAAIRVEEPDVFAAVHEAILRYVKQDWVTGLRIDHADGLRDPQQYLENIAEAAEQARREGSSRSHRDQSPVYLVVEKILAADESLPAEWPVHGTTGYDFLNLLNGLFVDRGGGYYVRNTYSRFINNSDTLAEVLYESKRTIVATSLSSELYMLSHRLDQISEHDRYSRDFTRLSLFRALRELVACFPVYRTYIRPGTDEVREQDRRRILSAVRAAKRRNPAMSATFFDFIASVLLLDTPDRLPDESRSLRREFVLKFQQVTGPVTAKGLEDTAFYRFYPLTSLNEVGGDPTVPGTVLEDFHARMSERCDRWPNNMSTTGTHDTKRGEDTRARLNVLSEIPQEWEEAIARWQAMNASSRAELDGAPVPDANEEYLIYQTLVGTWPVEKVDDSQREAYVQRIVDYLDKALREAKVHTSWLNPYEEYDQAVAGFIRKVLDNLRSPFASDVDAFVRTIADAGFLNSLGQTILKISCPGVPDFYQGCEFWDFSLVDPDNRRPVDFRARAAALERLRNASESSLAATATDAVSAWPESTIKLFTMWRGLACRQARVELRSGAYVPLVVEGPQADKVIAFARTTPTRWSVCLVPRLSLAAFRRQRGEPASGRRGALRWPIADWWSDTSVVLPSGSPTAWTHAMTGEALHAAEQTAGLRVLPLKLVFGMFPVAVLCGDCH